MSLLDQLKAKQEQPKAQVQEEPETVEVEEEVEVDTNTDQEELNQQESESTSTESAEDKLRRKTNRELFPDEIKKGKTWEEYQEAVKEHKAYCKEKGYDFLRTIAGVNTLFKKASTSTSTYVRKQKEMNAAEKEFDTAKNTFDTTVKAAIEKFQSEIDTLAKKFNYKPEEGKSPVVQRTAFIQNGKEFRDFLSEQK